MERIFENLNPGVAFRNPTDAEEDYAARVRGMIEDARDFNDTFLAAEREDDQAYYNGDEPALEEEGSSSIVATEARDTVMAILPSLMRIFASGENVVDFIPRSEDTVDLAEQQTEYINYVIWNDNEGFLELHSAIKDCLIKRQGIFKWWTDDNEEVKYKSFTDVSEEQFQYIMHEFQDKEFEIVEHVPDPSTMTLKVLRIKYLDSNPLTKFEAVPPDEFRIDRNAKSVKKATLVGHERMMTPSDLVEMGYDPELVAQYTNSGHEIRWNEERAMRNQALDQEGVFVEGLVLYGEYYIRVDKDGDGIAELRYICTMGDNDEIVMDEYADRVRFAMMTPDPEPHTAVGHSITEMVKDLQKIKTNVLRSALDSLAQSVWGRHALNDTLVNMEDYLSTDLSTPVRVKGNPADSIFPMQGTFVGDPALNMITYLDAVRQSRTGISEASKGVDPKALQSTTLQGVDAIVTGAQERIELIARILCETGIKDLYKGLLQEVTDNPNRNRVVRLRDKFVSVRLDAFDATMDLQVNPSIGRGTDIERLQVLGQVRMAQEMIIQQFGAQNPLVGVEEYRNTWMDMLKIANIRNGARYFKQIDPQQVAEAAEQVAKQPNPQLIVAQAEADKVRAQTAAKIADNELKKQQLETKTEFDMIKLKVDDDFRRDKMVQDAYVEGAKTIGQWGTDIHLETIKSEQKENDAKQREAGRAVGNGKGDAE